MKGKRIFWALCLACLGFYTAAADTTGDAVRAAVRRDSNTIVNTSRQKANSAAAGTTTTSARTTPSAAKTSSGALRDRATSSRANTTATPATTTSRRTTATPQTTSRPSATVQSRATATTGAISSAMRTPQRTTTTTRSAARTSVPTRTPARATTTRSDTTQSARVARAGAITTTARSTTAQEIMSKDYKKCREVYYECMDEFCANKDSQLKRCACSSRINEFDGVKKQLSAAEDKLLDFNQRLLVVNMDKEDAAALNKATEGELAFQQKDTSASKKMLDEISKKLNTSFSSNNFDSNLNAISWSLNADSAFDSVDSLMGASATSKSGPELYAAALPVCREMAREICSDDELAIAESGYQMTIEQDCNTVAKTYATQTDAARAKIREGGALLDMSRLDIYQKRNSDDILTCKKKMLDMLTDNTVCGKDLGKCLDTTGRYIDPSTGEAFLTVNLVDLANLIVRPDTGQSWTTAPGNDKFVIYLNSKKKFLEPAMESCQDISDYVWDAFIEDALAQIKLAQDSKLEEVRQSCTTLTTQCLSKTSDSLSDFDARALSTFGVSADKTVNAMCADVRTACTALLDVTGGGEDWIGGMTEIAGDKTYDTIMQTCREVGRACIIQACKGISGNFGLCENIQTSVNRKAIINRTSCWPEVQNCVASAGPDSIKQIMAQLREKQILGADGTFYDMMYGTEFPITITNTSDSQCHLMPQKDDNGKDNNLNCVFDICRSDCAEPDSFECQVCRLSEKIWGNCESRPTVQLSQTGSHNQIRTPIDGDTSSLLAWFAKNTGTLDSPDSCRDTSCGVGFQSIWDEATGTSTCVSRENLTDDGMYCPATSFNQFTPYNGTTNCCMPAVELNGQKFNGTFTPTTLWSADSNTWCCTGKVIRSGDSPDFSNLFQRPFIAQKNICTSIPANSADTVNPLFIAEITEDDISDGSKNSYPATKYSLYCIGDTTGSDTTDKYPSGQTIQCNGKYLLIDSDLHYITPKYSQQTGTEKYEIKNFIRIGQGDTSGQGKECYWNQASNKWESTDEGVVCPDVADINGWHIGY